MAKSIKLKDNNYIDSTGIVHNRKNLADILYPVGSIYMSVNNVNPSSLIGGTWKQIKDCFLLACGDTYSNGSTGGEATHTLTIDEIPAHKHTLYANADYRADDGSGYWGLDNIEGWAYGGEHNATNGCGTRDVGGGQPHNNMPPYLAVYCWYRVS